MGAQDILEVGQTTESFSEALLADLLALEKMLATGALESDVVRIGAEQEMFLVDRDFHPAPICDAVLARLPEDTFTTEIGKFEIEANLRPRLFGGDCLRSLEEDLNRILQQATEAARAFDADVLLTGMLPSARLSHLTIDNLTDRPRYRELNRMVMSLRGGRYHAFIRGMDELQLMHDNVVPEACCCSFQVHYQLDAKRFATQYNASLLAAAPVLSAAVNSPMFLGQRLWKETRIPLFQHSVDERTHAHLARQHPTRVTFGDAWVEDSVLEIYREQVARFRVLITGKIPESKGAVPELKALTLHNGTVWRWNRPCYGITDGRPNLRVEFRCLPAGPTVIDEVANAAFFFGLMAALPEELGNVAKRIPFEEVKENFFAAARLGMKAELTWLDGQHYASGSLILKHLLPLAQAGLQKAQVDAADIDKYLGVIRERARKEQTGASWMIRAAHTLYGKGSSESRDRTIVKALLERQKRGEPVHRWSKLSEAEMAPGDRSFQKVSDVMSTDLYTVGPDDAIGLAAGTMTWKHVRHLPVEDKKGRFIGLLSSRDLMRWIAEGKQGHTVKDVMTKDPLTVSPEMPTATALGVMTEEKLDCLAVMREGELIGLVTSQDMLRVLEGLLEQKSQAAAASGG